MWLFTDVPTDRIAREHGVQLSSELLERIRLGAARLGGGCFSSFVSHRDLVISSRPFGKEREPRQMPHPLR